MRACLGRPVFTQPVVVADAAGDFVDSPAELNAVTAKVWEVQAVRPVTVALVVLAVALTAVSS